MHRCGRSGLYKEATLSRLPIALSVHIWKTANRCSLFVRCLGSAIHATFKHSYTMRALGTEHQESRYRYRVDYLLATLLRISRDKAFERLLELDKGRLLGLVKSPNTTRLQRTLSREELL